MISIICASNNRKILEENLVNSLNNQTYKDYELIVIDTNKNYFGSAAEALNYGAKKAKGEYLVFTHHDIVMKDNSELKKIINYLKQINDFGVIGIAGITEDGNIIGNITNGIPEVKISKNVINSPIEVQTLDEVMVIVKKDFFDVNQFSKDNNTWHLYAIEYCILAQSNNKKVYVIPSNIYHKSAGASMDNSYYKELKRFAGCNKGIKKINTTMGIWHTSKIALFMDVLKNKFLIKCIQIKKNFPLK